MCFLLSGILNQPGYKSEVSAASGKEGAEGIDILSMETCCVREESLQKGSAFGVGQF